MVSQTPERLVREMLIEHAHALGRALAQRSREGAGRDDVARAVGHVEQRGVAFELVVVQFGEARGRAERASRRLT